jgi:hypothetical protein
MHPIGKEYAIVKNIALGMALNCIQSISNRMAIEQQSNGIGKTADSRL